MRCRVVALASESEFLKRLIKGRLFSPHLPDNHRGQLAFHVRKTTINVAEYQNALEETNVSCMPGLSCHHERAGGGDQRVGHMLHVNVALVPPRPILFHDVYCRFIGQLFATFRRTNSSTDPITFTSSAVNAGAPRSPMVSKQRASVRPASAVLLTAGSS